MKIMAVSADAETVAGVLCRFLDPHNGSMDLSLYPGADFVPDSPRIGRIDPIKDYHSPLRVASRDYEGVIVHDILHRHEMPLKLLQLIYRSMENSAEIIVVQNKGSIETSQIEGWLEQAEFRAANTIGDLIEGYDVIVAKKMHMWGNGL